MALLIDTKVFSLGNNLAILAEIACEHEILESQHVASGRSKLSKDAPVCTSVHVKAPFKEDPNFLVWTIQTTGWGSASRHPDTILKEVNALSLQDAFTLWLNREIKRLPPAEPVIEIG